MRRVAGAPPAAPRTRPDPRGEHRLRRPGLAPCRNRPHSARRRLLGDTPGGINAVLATAATTHVDVSLISSVQSPLLAMILFVPLFIRLVMPRAGHGAK
ncbi:AbrB family transcriptional regulator [Streptomyces violascens]|uniref:AbrB family transcriptional regulator n=1 Tax=Streptomyces violascens TaxID=67381 RepID=UPI0036AD2B2C